MKNRSILHGRVIVIHQSISGLYTLEVHKYSKKEKRSQSCEIELSAEYLGATSDMAPSTMTCWFPDRKCLGVRYRTPRPRVSASGTGSRDSGSRSPVPDAEPTQ